MKLTAYYRCNIAADMLREIAVHDFGAVRCSTDYLKALAHILGNQAHADRTGALLEMNTIVPFASQRTMRTLLGQLQARGITRRLHRDYGPGRVQAVSFYQGRRHGRIRSYEELQRIYQRLEAADDKRQKCDFKELDGIKRARWIAAGAKLMAASQIDEGDITH